MDARDVEKLYSELTSLREASNWDVKLTAASYLHHRDGYKGTRIEKRTTYDSTAVGAMATFVNGILGNLIPREQRWFTYAPNGLMKGEGGRYQMYTRYSHLDSDTKLYKQIVNLTDLVSVALEQSNFYTVMGMLLKDAAALGTGYMLIVDEWGHRERFGRGDMFRMRFQVLDPQQVVVAEDAHNNVNVCLRRFQMTSQAICDRWGVRVRGGQRELSWADSWEVYEAMSPVSSQTGPWEYLVVCPSAGGEIFRSLFSGCPVYRFAMNRDNDVTPYGMGLAPKYFDDVVSLDELGKAKLKMGQRAGSPPLMVPYSLKDNFSGKPSALVPFVDENSRAFKIFDGEDPSVLLTVLQDARECVRREFFADLFTAVMQSGDSRRTAYEISETVKQANNLLKENIYVFLDSFLSPLLVRCAEIVVNQIGYLSGETETVEMLKRDILPNVNVMFNSTFMRMLDDVMKVQGITQVFSGLPVIAQTFPGVQFNLKDDDSVRQWMIGLGLDSALVRDKEDALKRKSAYIQSLNQQASAKVRESESKANVNDAKAQAVRESGGTSGGNIQV